MKKEKIMFCEQAKIYYFDYLSLQTDKIPQSVGEHIKSCRFCQQEIERLSGCLEEQKTERNVVPFLALQLQKLNQWTDCRDVKPFLPILAIPRFNTAILTPVTAHIEHCSVCLKRLKTLVSAKVSKKQMFLASFYLAGDNSVSSELETSLLAKLDKIAQASNHMATKVQSKAEGVSEDSLTYDLKVQELSTAKPAGNGTVLQQNTTSSYAALSSLLKKGAIAAMLVLGFFVFFSLQTVKGTGIKDVYEAVSRIVGLRVETYIPEQTEPLQAIYLNRRLGLMYFEQAGEKYLYQTSIGTLTHKTSDGQKNLPFKKDLLKSIELPWGLLPFRNLADLPTGYTWRKVALPGKNPEEDIYDLCWPEKDGGVTVSGKRWRGYLNSANKLPYKIEWWERPPSGDYKITMTMKVSYPDDQMFIDVLQNAGFQYPFEQDHLK